MASANPRTPMARQCSHGSANFLSHWYDSTQDKQDLNHWSSALEVHTLATRPMRRWVMTMMVIRKNAQANSGNWTPDLLLSKQIPWWRLTTRSPRWQRERWRNSRRQRDTHTHTRYPLSVTMETCIYYWPEHVERSVAKPVTTHLMSYQLVHPRSLKSYHETKS